MPEQLGSVDIQIVFDLVEKFKTDKKHVVGVKTRLLEDAGLDSLAVMDLIGELQQKFEVVFNVEDYSFENFYSVENILWLIGDKRDGNNRRPESANLP